MKLQELLSISTPAAPSRPPRGAAADGRSSDFAGALTEAETRTRKSAEKPAPAEARSAKKPAPAKKGQAQPADAEPAQDAASSDRAAGAAEVVEPVTVAADEQGASTDDRSPMNEAEDDAADDANLPVVDADLSALTMTPFVGPHAVAQTVDEVADLEVRKATRQTICPPNLGSMPTTAGAGEGDAAATALAGLALDPNGIPLDGLEGRDQIPFALDELQAEPELESQADSAAAVIKQGRAPASAPEVPPHEAREQDGQSDATSPAMAGELAMSPESTLSSKDVTGPMPSGTPDTGASTTAPVTAPLQPDVARLQGATPAPAPAAPPPPPQAHFVEANHPTIVSAVRGELLPHGGSMQIRLDPPELGALQVLVNMKDGVMTASFQTSSDDATRLLSHSLSQLKQVLESQGVSVEKLQVQQAPKDQQAGDHGENGDHQRDPHDDAHRQEQQRKEMLRRMWRRLANGSDPLDLVA